MNSTECGTKPKDYIGDICPDCFLRYPPEDFCEAHESADGYLTCRNCCEACVEDEEASYD